MIVAVYSSALYPQFGVSLTVNERSVPSFDTLLLGTDDVNSTCTLQVADVMIADSALSLVELSRLGSDASHLPPRGEKATESTECVWPVSVRIGRRP